MPDFYVVQETNNFNEKGDLWEINEWVAVELTREGILDGKVHDDNRLEMTAAFAERWGDDPGEYEVMFSIAVATMQAIQSLEEREGDTDELCENAKANLVDTLVILKGGRV